MKHQSKTNNITPDRDIIASIGTSEIVSAFKKTEGYKNFFQQCHLPNLNDLLAKLVEPVGEKVSWFSITTGISMCLQKTLLFSMSGMNHPSL